MATIQINALNPTGSGLFADSESYLKELTDADMAIEGGYSPAISIIVSVLFWTLREC